MIVDKKFFSRKQNQTKLGSHMIVDELFFSKK